MRYEKLQSLRERVPQSVERSQLRKLIESRVKENSYLQVAIPRTLIVWTAPYDWYSSHWLWHDKCNQSDIVFIFVVQHFATGIRYGQAPVGRLRFRKPVPPIPQPHMVFSALELPPTCPQPKDTMFQVSWYPGICFVAHSSGPCCVLLAISIMWELFQLTRKHARTHIHPHTGTHAPLDGVQSSGKLRTRAWWK